MIDSLGSTLSSETVNSFTRNGKKPVEDALTVDEAIRCLNMQIVREKKRVVPAEEGGSLLDLSTPDTPGGSGMGMSRSWSMQAPLQLGKLDFSGLPMHLFEDLEVHERTRNQLAVRHISTTVITEQRRCRLGASARTCS
jgi:phosphatidylserine decarboxylase